MGMKDKQLAKEIAERRMGMIAPLIGVLSSQEEYYEKGGKIMKPELVRYAAMLRSRRLELGLTQEEVAFDVGIAYQQYQNFEYGYRSIKTAGFGLGLRICAVLELDPYELVFANDKDWVKGQEWLK